MKIQVPVFGTFARDSSLGSVSRNVVVTKKQCRLGDEVRKRSGTTLGLGGDGALRGVALGEAP